MQKQKISYINQNILIKASFIALLSVYNPLYAYAQQADFSVSDTASNNTIITLELNKTLNLDYEVIVNADNTFSIPFKTIAKLLEIPYSQNHLTKDVIFTLDDGKKGIISYQQQKVSIGENSYLIGKNNSEKIIFISQGLMETTQDELFVPLDDIKKILKIQINQDMANFSINLVSPKTLKAVINQNNETASEQKTDKIEDFKQEQIVLPSAKPAVSLNTIEFSNDSLYNLNKGGEESINDSPFTNSTDIKLNGSLLGGNYTLNSYSRSARDTGFFFGGVSANYARNFKTHNLEIGQLDGIDFSNFKIGQGIIGSNFNNNKDYNQNITDISGKASQGSTINIYINDKFYANLPTIAGYYNLNSMPQPKEKVYKLRLEEVLQEGKTQTITEKYYPINPQLLPAKIKEYSLFTGVTGYDDRFFNDFAYNKYRAKKYSEGAKYSYGIKNNLTVHTAIINDNIISLPSEINLKENYNTDQNILALALGTSRDFNTVYGQTGLFSADYFPFDFLNIKTDFGLSHQKSKIKNSDYDIGSLGYMSQVSTKYEKPQYNVRASFYNYSPDFYLSGSSGLLSSSAYLNDRLGTNVGGSITKKYLALDGSWGKYFTNLDRHINGGMFTFDEYNYSVRLPIKYFANINFYNSYKIGKNTTGKITNTAYKLNLDRKLSKRSNVNLTGSFNRLDTKYNATGTTIDRGYSSDFWLFASKFDYDMPNNLGSANLEHEIVNVVAKNSNVEQPGGLIIPLTSYTNKYNVIRTGYTLPTIKNFSPHFSVGWHYTGINRGLDYTLGLAYLFKSGARMELNFQYNRVAGTFIDDFFIPSSSRYSFNFNLNNTLALVGKSLKTIDYSDKNSGFIKAITFLDVNKNGIKDNKEPSLPYMPINISGSDEQFNTDKKGHYITKAMPEGFYKIKIDMNKLPSLLSLSPKTQNEYLARIDKNTTTKVFLGLVSSVGNIFGSIKITDEFQREFHINDLIVAVYDENGTEIAYTSVNSDGTYNISGLAPGKYNIGIDKDFIEAYNLSLNGNEAKRTVTIPPVYDTFVDITDLNLEYTKPSVTRL